MKGCADMTHAVEKLENPARVKELSIERILDELGVSGDASLCDVGAGTGLFSLAGAKRTAGTVYAFEISDELLELIKERAEAQGLSNIRALKVEGPLPLADACCEAGLLATVYHELDDAAGMLAELRRVLKKGGKLAAAEFREGQTPMGPPPSHRVGEEDLKARFEAAGFRRINSFALGENLYCSVFEN
jgi:ubiquinone/menaquinone biosynthesis C-methylase UbiE